MVFLHCLPWKALQELVELNLAERRTVETLRMSCIHEARQTLDYIQT
jgi:hypothetical protein